MGNNYMTCRRKNYVQAAYVEAAVYINKVFGSDRAYWMLIRENVPGLVIDRVLKGDVARVRRKDRRYATRRTTVREPEPSPVIADLRKDHLTSQRVEVAIVFQLMLGEVAAKEYLSDLGVPAGIIERVLNSTKKRSSPILMSE